MALILGQMVAFFGSHKDCNGSHSANGRRTNIENELRVCEEAFSLSYLQAGSLPRGVHYLSVLCDMQTVLQLADGTSTLPVSVRLKGFVQTQRMDVRTCQHWLSPPHFAWHLLHVGSGLHDKDSTDYETAMLQSQAHRGISCYDVARVSRTTPAAWPPAMFARLTKRFAT